MKEQTRIRTAVLVTSLIAGLSAQAAVLTVSDGVTTNSITLTGGIGFFDTGSFDTSWGAVTVTAQTKPALGSASSPYMGINIQAISLGSANPLTITLSDTGFGPTSGNDNVAAQLTGQPIGGTGGVVTFNTYYDTNNTLDALTKALTSSGSLLPGAGNEYVGNETGTLSLTGPYSLSEVLTINGTQAATYSLLGSVQGSNAPCVCVVSFSCPANQAICASDPVPNPLTEAAQISATDTCLGTVPVSFISATTNGSCPTLITYTFGATSGCGQLSTCSQTITVNCLPTCDVTTVSNTIAGTSNLTASVQSAGTGASYSWSIMNGTITAGQGTSSITYTAGTDTSNPVHVCVTVDSAAGCESTCCASVTVSPPTPPTITLKSGDTATIGFWHNKNGQAVINSASNSPALGNWLASTFPCMLGSQAGKSDSEVASDYLTYFGNTGGLVGNDSVQFFACALACYFTSTDLGGNSTASGKGFNQSADGTGGHTYNVGSNGAAFGVPNNTNLTVLQILQYIDANECPLSGQSTTILGDINDVLNGINQGGDLN